MKTTRAHLCSIAMLMILAGSPAAHAALTPTETVNTAIGTVMRILNDPAFEQPGMSDARRGAIENVVRSFVSYQDMARHSLGIAWVGLSDPERHRFVDLFIQMLRDAVACRINGYSTTPVVYLSEHRDGHTADVQTLFRGDKVDTVITIRLVNRSGAWLMYDAIVDDVRLVENYRAQFEHVMRTTSYIGLVRSIEAQALLQKSFERTLMR